MKGKLSSEKLKELARNSSYIFFTFFSSLNIVALCLFLLIFFTTFPSLNRNLILAILMTFLPPLLSISAIVYSLYLFAKFELRKTKSLVLSLISVVIAIVIAILLTYGLLYSIYYLLSLFEPETFEFFDLALIIFVLAQIIIPLLIMITLFILFNLKSEKILSSTKLIFYGSIASFLSNVLLVIYLSTPNLPGMEGESLGLLIIGYIYIYFVIFISSWLTSAAWLMIEGFYESKYQKQDQSVS